MWYSHSIFWYICSPHFLPIFAYICLYLYEWASYRINSNLWTTTQSVWYLSIYLSIIPLQSFPSIPSQSHLKHYCATFKKIKLNCLNYLFDYYGSDPLWELSCSVVDIKLRANTAASPLPSPSLRHWDFSKFYNSDNNHYSKK